MSNNKEDKKTEKNDIEKVDPELKNTPDPQDEMEGPISSLIKKTGEGFKTDTTKEEADKEKDENL